FLLNRSYPAYPGEARWRRAAKWLREHWRHRLSRYASRLPPGAAAISVREEQAYTEDLLPQASPFAFRFAPPLDYLAWRYHTALSFVRYRLFRILQGATTLGHVILNEAPDRLLVAQCDGADAATLAHGVLRSIPEASRADRQPR